MACNHENWNQCDACFNWGSVSGSFRARALNNTPDPHNCKTLLNQKVDFCKYYSGKTLMTSNTLTIDSCSICDRDFLNWNQEAKSAACSDTPTAGCTAVDNCLTTVCYSGGTGAASSGCRMCKAGYWGDEWDPVNHAGSKKCIKGEKFTNCIFAAQLGIGSETCYGCSPRYATSNSQDKCVSFTGDQMCRRLAVGDLDCYYCWHGYFWDFNKCKLGGQMVQFFTQV